MLSQMARFHSFLKWLNNISLCVHTHIHIYIYTHTHILYYTHTYTYTTFSLFIHPSRDTGCFHDYSIVNNTVFINK